MPLENGDCHLMAPSVALTLINSDGDSSQIIGSLPNYKLLNLKINFFKNRL